MLFQARSENHEGRRRLVSSGSLRRWLIIALKYIGLLILALVEEIVLSSQRGAVELVAYFFTGFLQLQVKIFATVWSVGDNGSVIANCKARVSGERRNRVNLWVNQFLVDGFFLGVANGQFTKEKVWKTNQRTSTMAIRPSASVFPTRTRTPARLVMISSAR